MSFEPGALVLSTCFGFIGLALFVYGKKQLRMPQLVAGLLFMVFPYFTSSAMSMFVVGMAVALALWGFVHMGW